LRSPKDFDRILEFERAHQIVCLVEDIDPLSEIDGALNRVVADDISCLEKGGSPRCLDTVKLNAFGIN
jgi:hypothetical protein